MLKKNNESPICTVNNFYVILHSPLFFQKQRFFYLFKIYLFFREKEREHQRQELWNKVEILASSRPEYDGPRNFNMMNNMITSPENDEEFNLDNLKIDDPEVSLCDMNYYCY